jgi:hypothetical protein
MNRVFDLSERLRDEGVDCEIDQYQTSPAGGWPRWTRNQIREVDFVLVVCTKNYERRYLSRSILINTRATISAWHEAKN